MEPRIHYIQSLDGLRLWLKTSETGKVLLRELTEEAFEKVFEDKCRTCQQLRPYPRVLVVLRQLGRFPGVEVYAEEGITIKFLEVPDVSDENGALVEEFIELSVPRSWRYMIDLPAKRIVREVFRGMSLVEALRHQDRKLALKEMRLLEDIGRPTELT